MSALENRDPSDTQAMERALQLAHESIGLSDPNPRVGCVLVGPGWRSEGFTQAAGEAHAEIMALRAGHAAGHDLQGATAYVTLEPCSHHGRTPPCCDAMIEAGLGRVVVAGLDPNPLVCGQGIARMRAAGIKVEVGLMAAQARELNIGFYSRMLRRRPWVRMKIAASLDGRTALDNGVSQWITGEAARRDGHGWRKRANAVLTGVGTVREDNPRLDVRWVDTAHQPLRVVVDSRLETPLDARVLQPPGQVLLYAAAADLPRATALRARGAEVTLAPGEGGKVDLAVMLSNLAERGINELHVEAGHKLNGSLWRAGLVDELLVYLAPKMLGAGRDMAAFGPLERLDDATALAFVGVERIGDDLRILARPPGRDVY
jgi:diaminohydroxyphosphoribosylaminopyrimidine deaminase/5-amino-6-(5-phosphoribosylamino)uracil reductase